TRCYRDWSSDVCSSDLLLSHFGLAREIAALTGKKLKSTPRESKIAIKKTGVTITATHECPFFSARKIDNVKVGPSPQWLRAKIRSEERRVGKECGSAWT